MMKGAEFSKCGKFRYRLWRIWDESKPLVAFCMLNPSTADEFNNDPTVTRCQRRAKMMGYGGMIVINLFSFRSTNPKALLDHDYTFLIGPKGTNAIIKTLDIVSDVICGWGKLGKLRRRGSFVLNMMRRSGKNVMVLKYNKDMSPAHPLYIGYDVKPIPIDFEYYFP